MDRLVFSALALVLAGATAALAAPLVTRQATPPDGAAAAMVAAERAFCKRAAESSIRDAFYEYFDDGAIAFRPGPVNGKEYYLARPSNPGPVLTWWPTYAEVAASGELGWTTGPWEFMASKGQPVEAWGHFATVWQRGADDRWHVLIDEGHSGPQPPADSLTWAVGRGRAAGSGDSAKPAELAGELKQLGAIDQAYSEALAGKGMGPALAQFGDEDVLLYREEKPAIVGAAAAGRELAHEWDGGASSWNTNVGAVSKALDLGFTFGTVQVPKPGTEAKSGRKIFRIWRRGPEGPWKLVLDVTNDMPPPPAPPKPPKPPKGASSR
ncbi:MAG: DUF4440 domain-containing protein [Candidatus Eisenbacteria bacterium]